MNTTLMKTNMTPLQEAFYGNGHMINLSNISMTQRKKISNINQKRSKIPTRFGRTWDSWVITFCIMLTELFLACPLLCRKEVQMEVNQEQ